ncbi:MAG: hypothetical protein HOV81_23525 [Kofleriaceae bacterium]|nr:hypothetical protein [Kofleriaceae bacterium]
MRSITLAFLIGAVAFAGCGDPPKLSVEELQNPETCKECHPKHYEQWSGSMHAYASEDPVFVAMNKRGQRDTGGALGDFCIQCHAPMAKLLGLASGSNYDPAALPPEAKGITCFFCHNVEKVEGDHNNGLVIALDQTMRGGVKNAADTPAHFSKFDPTLMASKTNDSTLCGSCHDVTTTPADVHLERTFAEWKTTIFAQDSPQTYLTCSKCHMTPTTGVIADKPGLDVKSRTDGFHDHHMAAIDSALTPFPQLDTQKAEIEKILKPAVAIVGVRPLGSTAAPGGICVLPNGTITVRVDSLGVGHSFPSGAAQDRRVWIELTAYDAGGAVVFSSGHVPDDKDPEQVDDRYLQCPTGNLNCAGFWDRTYKADNTQAHFFWDVARYDSNLIRPPVTLDPNSVDFDHSTTVTYQVGATSTIDRVEARILVRPLPIAALDELVASGDLDPAIRAKLVSPEATLVATTSTWLKSTAIPASRCNPF